MDTALKAMKRAARAVLRDELRGLRNKLRDAHSETATVTAECTMKLHENNQRMQSMERELGRARDEAHGFRIRATKVIAWGEANRSGDLGFKCCAEYMQAGPTPLTYGAGGLYINPFDRWQVKPALR